jgi:hypothetical protein
MEFINDNIWKPIHQLPGYECCIEYYINDKGQVKSTKGRLNVYLNIRISRMDTLLLTSLNVLVDANDYNHCP